MVLTNIMHYIMIRTFHIHIVSHTVGDILYAKFFDFTKFSLIWHFLKFLSLDNTLANYGGKTCTLTG